MNKRLLVIIGVTALCAAMLAMSVAVARPRTDVRQRGINASALDRTAFLGVNKLGLVMTNTGGFAYDIGAFYGKNDGLYFPFTTLQDILDRKNTTSAIFAAGLWVGAIDSTAGSPNIGDTLVTVGEYSEEWYPGPWGSNTENPPGKDNPDYRFWVISKDSIDYYTTGGRDLSMYNDWANWPVSQGAPVDSAGNPALIGDEMWWCVFNDGEKSFHTNDAGATDPLGLEVRATYFAFDRTDALGNVIFMRFRIFNKGGKDLRQMFISLWADPDLGGAGDDFVGSDTLLSLGYCYNATNTDNSYGSKPPAVGFDFFQGPLILTGDNADTAKMWDTTFVGYVNMGMTSFNKYINGTDPQNFVWTYQYMNGLDASQGGTPLPNGTKFFGPGDPVTGIGDIDANPSDRRFMQTTGPISLAPGDSTEILAAIIVGQGSDRLTSISALKFFDEFAQTAYDLDFQIPEAPAAPEVTAHHMADAISIEWTNKSEINHGDYPFQGYTLYQGESPSGPWKRLANWDVDDGVGVIFDRDFDIENGVVIEKPLKFGSDNGLQRYFGATQDFINGGKLNNATEYYYKVEAYSYDGTKVPKTQTSATVVTVTPQQPQAGTEIDFTFGDTLATTHNGPSDGTAVPFVLSPEDLTGHTYQIVFTDDGAGGFFWNLDDVTANSRVIANQTNQTGNEDYPIADGMLLKVMGPPLQGKDWSYTAANPPNISPVALADHPSYTGNNRWFTGGGHGGELLFGGVFMEPNFWGATTVAPGDIKTVEIRFRPMASYTDLNGDGKYTIGEPYTVDDPAQTQKAFMYQTFNGAAYEGFFDVPFTAWDVTDPANPRQLNVVVRDRDADQQWDLHIQHDPAVTDTTGLPNGGDLRFNYTWILNTDYDPTGTMYGDGTGGSLDFFAADGGNAVYDAMWTLWLDERGSSRGPLAEECTLKLIPNIINTAADTFTFVAQAPSTVTGQQALDRIRAVPNPYYLDSKYDLSSLDRRMKFT
ncbi:MAG: hypothetical protein D6800_00365, partial [Candidatus Zixiibacteriota bacterium]